MEKPKKIPVQLRLTQSEYAMLKQQAQAKGLNLAGYLRYLIYQKNEKTG